MSKKALPEKYRTIIALLKFEDVPPIPLTGFIADTVDTHEPYFHAFNKRGYSVELIAKWNYLDEIAPGYALPVSEKHERIEND